MNTNTNKFIDSLNGAERVLYNSEIRFYTANGYSELDAEINAYNKIQSVRKFKNNKSILRY